MGAHVHRRAVAGLGQVLGVVEVRRLVRALERRRPAQRQPGQAQPGGNLLDIFNKNPPQATPKGPATKESPTSPTPAAPAVRQERWEFGAHGIRMYPDQDPVVLEETRRYFEKLAERFSNDLPKA